MSAIWSPENQGSIFLFLNVGVYQRNFSTAFGKIECVERHRQAGKAFSKLRLQLHSIFDRNPQMNGSADQISLKEVIGFDPVR